MTFDLSNVNQRTLYNSNNGIVSIAISGYYYVYISAGVEEGQVGKTCTENYVNCTENKYLSNQGRATSLMPWLHVK